MSQLTPQALARPPFDLDDFLVWKESPLTKYVFAYLKEQEEALLTQWIARSWHGGKCDPVELARWSARAEALKRVRELDYYQLTGRQPLSLAMKDET